MRDLKDPPVIVIGAGIGGLACALRLAATGTPVLVLEAAGGPGGKMRTLPTPAGPVDAGPTVFTLRHVFDDLFAAAGLVLQDHLDVRPAPILARHWWADGKTLDLVGARAANQATMEAFCPGAGAQYRTFEAESAALFAAFDVPVMQADTLNLARLMAPVLRDPLRIGRVMAAPNLDALLRRRFTDPHLRQLFGRYATYVGGAPGASPALLALIWQAEAQGVWSVEGGMHRLAQVIAQQAEAQGAAVRYNCAVREILTEGGAATGVICADGTRINARAVMFNGDPAALHRGMLGQGARLAVKHAAVAPRSLSACVWSFAATPVGRELSHHNVFFGDDADAEFGAIAKGLLPQNATYYVCAQDRAGGAKPEGLERFEIILNAPAGLALNEEEKTRCHAHMMHRLERMGLCFTPPPGPDALTIPQDFATLFPGSDGSLYGRSPQGVMASFARPTARSRIAGLYLAGGGVHPGPGVPMAALSGKHAAEAILSDLALTSTSQATAMHGGMSTD